MRPVRIALFAAAIAALVGLGNFWRQVAITSPPTPVVLVACFDLSRPFLALHEPLGYPLAIVTGCTNCTTPYIGMVSLLMPLEVFAVVYGFLWLLSRIPRRVIVASSVLVLAGNALWYAPPDAHLSLWEALTAPIYAALGAALMAWVARRHQTPPDDLPYLWFVFFLSLQLSHCYVTP